MNQFWPVAESSQASYEKLREAALSSGRLPDDLASARFGRRGVAGLIAWAKDDPIFWAEFVGATRPAWSPYADPRLDALRAAYEMLLGGPGGYDGSLMDQDSLTTSHAGRA